MSSKSPWKWYWLRLLTLISTKQREVLMNAKVPTIVVSDGPAKKAVPDIEKIDAGYLIVEADAT
jgi:F420-dependent methylenetetrahydromethanopterin dehydrogenase